MIKPLFCSLVLFVTGAQAVTTLYRDEAGFLSAIGNSPSVVDYFDTPQANGLSVTFSSQIVSVASKALNGDTYNTVSPGAGTGPVSGGRYLGFLDENDPSSITWTMPAPTTALGFTIQSDQNEVIIGVGSDSYFPNITSESDDEFFGITSATPFSEITFTIPTSEFVVFTAISIDNLYLGAIPEPASWATMLGSVAFLALLLRRIKRKR